MTQYPILAIDYGEKHFGLAVSDSKGILATPLETLSKSKRTHTEDILTKIAEIIEEYRIKTILLGYPQAFEKTATKNIRKDRQFQTKANRKDLPSNHTLRRKLFYNYRSKYANINRTEHQKLTQKDR